MYPTALVIDDEEIRSQRMGRLLALIDYRPFIVTRAYDAFERVLQRSMLPERIFLGKLDATSQTLLPRFLQYLDTHVKKSIPLQNLPKQVPETVPLYADATVAYAHAFARPTLQFLQSLLPENTLDVQTARQSMHTPILIALHKNGLIRPRVAREKHMQASYFRHALKAAYEVIGDAQWGNLLIDVGLPHYSQIRLWPAENDDQRSIPLEYFSCLHQALVFSEPAEQVKQLRHWGELMATQTMQRLSASSSLMAQQVMKLRSPERMLQDTLTAIMDELNEARGEELHFWRRQPDGGYWLTFYSNPYTYGRLLARQPSCHVWVAFLARVIQLLKLDTAWDVKEIECSCQTLTGHCVLALQPL
jgi:hypothetical protein